MKTGAIVLLLLAACAAPEPKPAQTSSAGAPAKQTIPPPSAADAQRIIAASAEFSDYEFTNASVTLPMKAPLPPYLAGEAKGDKRFLVRPNGYVDIVPLASKELTGVTSVTPNSDGTVSADMTWTWIPNEVGSAFARGPLHDRYAAPQKATARLMWDGSAWTVLRITPR